MANLFRPTYRHSNIAAPRTGDLGLDTLNQAFGQMQERALLENQQQEDKRRWEADQALRQQQLGWKEEEMDWKRDEVNRLQNEREFLQNYRPEIGMQGGRGMTRDLLEPVSQAVGSDIERVNKRYDLGEGRSLGDLSSSELANYRKDIGGISGQAEGAMRQLASPTTDLVTQEAVADRVFSDVLGRTGNAQLAQAQAQSYSAPYSTRNEIQKNEQARAESMQSVIDRRRDAMKDNYDMLQDRAKQFDKKTSKDVSKQDLYEYVDELLPDTFGIEIDSGDTIKSINGIAGKTIDGKPVTNEEIMDVMKNEFVRGRWDRDFTFETPEELGEKIREYRNSGQFNRNLSTWDMLENQRQQINRLGSTTVAPESLPAMQREASGEAYRGNILTRELPTNPAQRSPSSSGSRVRDLFEGTPDEAGDASTEEGSVSNQDMSVPEDAFEGVEGITMPEDIVRDRLSMYSGEGRPSGYYEAGPGPLREFGLNLGRETIETSREGFRALLDRLRNWEAPSLYSRDLLTEEELQQIRENSQ